MPSSIVEEIQIRARNGLPIAVVEVKNIAHLSPDAATELRDNFIKHGLLASVSHFLLVSQDVGYLWRPCEPLVPQAPPSSAFDMRPMVARYLPAFDPAHRLLGSALELLVVQWLSDLVHGSPGSANDPERSLAACGFLEAIRGAEVFDPLAA